ncbi:MAG TPA: ABC transporter ATP-binding protein [Rhodopila sp.]|uniref:ABC transporter ATP-binding protein n=1 Tax=Rhodopila sp. TaxID=2480087 RepID=UPI002D17640F|nr:ABC transporter ATP-binding protein [Rhodopila sp.]HVY14070.1 ABC transporter ATP-binding protein [Rhodopila sp.]
MTAIGIEAVGIGKQFGAFHALTEVSMKVEPATVHGLLGENGAGKSTLVKCLLGYYRADDGGFIVDGREVAIERPADADALGLGMVYQHFTLVPSMTVAENLVMSRANVPALINWRDELDRLHAFMERMPFKVPLEAEVGSLAAGERQKTEIVKQLYLHRKFLVLDEPTSVLTPQEAAEMLGLVRDLAHSGALTIVIITHRLKEVFAFVDEVTVLRRGRLAGAGRVRDLTPDDMTAMMIGEPHAPKSAERIGAPAEDVRLALSGLTTEAEGGRKGLSIEKLTVRAHEIVGIAGVSGNGQKDLVEVLGGQRPIAGGEILVDQAPYAASRAESQARDVRVLPEEPLRNGCVPPMTVIDNLNLRAFDTGAGKQRRFWLDRAGMADRARAMIAAYGIRTPSPEAPIAVLSGGNVQRCVLARELDGDVRLLVVANPCFGLDVKAVAETRARIMAARNAGTAVLLISEDLDEILELADRIVVMHEGQVVHEMPAEGADPQEIGKHMLGHH